MKAFVGNNVNVVSYKKWYKIYAGETRLRKFMYSKTDGLRELNERYFNVTLEMSEIKIAAICEITPHCYINA